MAKATRRSKLASLLVGLALSLGVSTFVGPGSRLHSPVRQAVATEVPVAVAEDFQALAATPLRRASDGAEVALTSLWSEDEKANVKLFVVGDLAEIRINVLVGAVTGIGSSESAKDFAEQLGLPAEIVFGDEEAESYKKLRFVNSDFSEDGRKRGMRMMTERTAEAVKSRANGRPVSFFGLFDIPFLFTNDDLETAKEIYKPLMPQGEQALDKTLVQGGVLVFKGQQQVYKHRDSSVAVHAELPKVMAALA